MIIRILLQFYLVALFQVRAATDSKLIELQKKFSSLKENNERGEKSREKLSGELKDVKKKVLVLLPAHLKRHYQRPKICSEQCFSLILLNFFIQARGLEDDLAAQTKEAAKYLTALGDVYSKVQT